MKTKIFCLVTALCLISVYSFSQNAKVNIFQNHSNNEKGITKEFTEFESNTAKPLSKKIYVYNAKGKRTEEVIYKWDKRKGWVGTKMYTYIYTGDKLTTLIYKKRDKQTGKWSNRSENMVYTYDNNGKLLSMKKIEVNDVIINNLLTQK